MIQTFDAPMTRQEISIHVPVFASRCHFDGEPDFASMEIVYTPNKKCVELKSLMDYIKG
jgi:7-cyano-7-deazaguanine reductase